MKNIYILFLSFCCCQAVWSQTLPVGSVQEETYRNLQLLGKAEPSSMSVRPLAPELLNVGDSTVINLINNPSGLNFWNGKGSVKILPIIWKQQYNSHHPFGYNDGAMIPAKGYQTIASMGLFAKLGLLTIQLQPEFVYASNKIFSGFAYDRNDTELGKYYFFNTFIDNPERFGNSSYSKAYFGQSSIRLNYKGLSVGLSTENIWWGPGNYNSLMLTNDAPGFKHVTIGTTKPIKTYIGNFEGELIGGKLENSGISPLSITQSSTSGNLYWPGNPEWRYLSGMNINYQPKWLPGLYLGFTRTFMAYNSEINKFSDYVPFLAKLSKESGDQDNYDRDQRISLYAKWLLQKSNAEVYFEYGLNDNSYNFRDFFGSPQHSRSYLVGFSKIMPIRSKNNEFIKINSEITQLSQTPDRIVRDAGSFYQHFQVTQGYTHLGQNLGAGSGTGGNVQSLDVKYYKQLKGFGFNLTRLEHNVDFYQDFIKDYNGHSRKWVDFAVGITGQWDYKNFIINTKLQGIQSLNYQWYMKDFVPGKNYIPHNDIFNFHGELGVFYRF